MNKELLALMERAFGQLGAGSKYAMGELAAYYRADAIGNLVLWLLLTSVLSAVVLKWAKPAIAKEFALDEAYWSGEGVAATVFVIASGIMWLVYTVVVWGSSFGILLEPTGYVFDKIVNALR